MVKWIDSLNENLEKAAEWTGKNFKMVAGVLAVVLVVGAVLAALNYSKENKGTKAFGEYAPIEREYAKWKTPEAAAKTEDAKKQPPAAKVDPQALFDRMLKFIADKGDLPASQLMALMASDVASTLGPASEAQLLAEIQKHLGSGNRLTEGLALLKKGDLEANADKCDEALKTWKQVLDKSKLSYLHDTARLKSGICFEKLAKYKEAEGEYDQIIKGTPAKSETERNAQAARQKHWAVKEAQKLKRALKWSQRQPSST